MASSLSKLNKVLYNIREDVSLDAIKDFITLEDIKEFFNKMGYQWSGFCCYNDNDCEEEHIKNINQLCDLLKKESADDDNYKEINEAMFDLSSKEEGDKYYKFIITPCIFYYRSDVYQHLGNGEVEFFGKDYSKQWMRYLFDKYKTRYSSVVKKYITKGMEQTNMITGSGDMALLLEEIEDICEYNR